MSTHPFNLLNAARSGNLDSAFRQVSLGADVNTTSPQYSITPLHLASRYGHAKVAQFLLDNNASPNVVDEWTSTPLHLAAGAGHADIVRELCDHGAGLDHTDNTGQTPLELAREYGRLDVIPVLEEYESRGDSKDRCCIKMYGGGGGIRIRWQEKNPGQTQSSNNSDRNGADDDGGMMFGWQRYRLDDQLRELEKWEHYYQLLHKVSHDEKKNPYLRHAWRNNTNPWPEWTVARWFIDRLS